MKTLLYTYFIICFIVSSLTVIGIMLGRRIFRKQLSVKGKYHMWFLLMVALILPFIPFQLLPIKYPSIDLSVNQHNEPNSVLASTEDVQKSNWIQDYSLSIHRINIEYLGTVLTYLWIAGMLVMLCLSVKAWLDVKRIKRTTSPLVSKDVQFLFEQCKKQLGISGHIAVGESKLVNSPMIIGLLSNCVIMPSNFDQWLSKDEIKYIFLHELNHYKYKDTAVNYLILFFQVIYWFNPFVWVAFRKMQLDREIACDHAVLSSLDENYHKEYGLTIIHFIEKASQQKNLILANQFNGFKKQMKSRIEHIACYTKESKLLKLKSIVVFMMLGILVGSQVPFISAMAQNRDRYEFKSEKTSYLNLSNLFKGYDGSFVLYDNQTDQYKIYNKDKSTLRVSPTSTYKIYSALIGLESNIITGENSTLNWNRTKYPFDSWNSEQNLNSAMKNSVTWYFQELDKKNQARIIESYLKRLHYGNSDMSGGISQYWLESSLKISPVEQVQLLKNFYTNQIGFKDKNVQVVKEAIKLEQKNKVLLSGKTGTGAINGKEVNGWFIGYVEKGKDTYFFATNIERKEKATGKKAAEITLSILKDMGIY
ncbi:BlaR1 family beta-lactam sensor/signal transducer [Rummeliibacillus stabekisii]|uniref:BlaR1 family beta-lactam sensor/signal transducer n=1 Tax=Rummeliibacillus stabekisii TaxID=241244 RepID=UPI002FF95C2F